MTFEDFGFDERIRKGIDEAGFETPMPVQAQCFELLIKEHRDIYAQSQTGTGKTAAFLLGIYQLKIAEEKYKNEKALVIVPTRELAVQIEREGKKLGKYLDFKIGSVFGGVGYGGQERMLEQGIDVLIGTPGRLIDFNKQRKLNFKDFGFLVIDEADRLFDMGFLPDLRKILKGMRSYNERHTMLFSATMNARVGNLAWEYMNDPGEVIIEPEKVTVDTVTQELYHVGKDEKMKLLLGILNRDNPENAVIFTNTRHSAWEVAKRMEVNGYAVEFLMGDLPQSKRLKIVDEVKKGDHKFLVATDVAARGLHIDDLQMVINYDVPLEAESYVHRIGRTARAGAEGKTVTLACEEYVYGLGPIEKLLGEKIPVSWADENLLIADKSDGMRFPPQDRYRELGSDRRDGRSGSSRYPSGGGRNDGRDKGKARRDERNPNTRRSTVPGGQAHKSGNGPSGGKKPLDPRSAHIQSVVSSIAGGDLDGFADEVKGGKGKKKRQPPQTGKTENRKTRTDKSRKDVSGPEKPKGAEGKYPNAAKSTAARVSGSKNNRSFSDERVSSDSSIDERLEYYRKKYGEDFKLSESSASSSGKSGGKKVAPAPKSGKKKETRKSNDQPKDVNNARRQSSPPPAGKKMEPLKEEKKGFFSRLFGSK